MNKSEKALKEIAKIIHDYEEEENPENIISRIQNICDVPTEDLDPSEIYFLFDMLRCLLYRYGMIAKNNVPEDVRTEEIDDLELPESAEMIDAVVEKMFSIMHDYGLTA